MSAAAQIHIVRFWTKFVPDRSDASKLKPIDMIAYGPMGQTQKTLVHTEVARLSAIQQNDDAESNPAIAMARARWEIIKPHYEAWKAGNEMPVTGTPLAAWNAVTPEQAEVLKARGVKTVEDVSQLNDAAIQGIPVPHLRDLKRNAERFLASADTMRVAAFMADKDRAMENQQLEMNDLKTQNAALMEKVNQLAELVAAQSKQDGGLDLGEGGEAKRRPGRPPNAARSTESTAA